MAKTIREYLAEESNERLLKIEKELLTGVLPADGEANKYCREINRKIDKGELCINPFKYRKVYMPTLSKMVQRELASRYYRLMVGSIDTPESFKDKMVSIEEARLKLDDLCAKHTCTKDCPFSDMTGACTLQDTKPKYWFVRDCLDEDTKADMIKLIGFCAEHSSCEYCNYYEDGLCMICDRK